MPQPAQVLAGSGGKFKFGAVDRAAAGVLEVSKDTVLGSVAVAVISGKHAELDIVVVVAEHRCVEREPVIEPAALCTKFVGRDGFVLKRQARLRHGLRIGADVVSAALETAADLRIQHERVVRRIGKIDARRRRVENRRIGKVSRHPAIRLGKRGVGVALVEHRAGFSFRVAQAKLQAHLVVEVPDKITEERGAFGLHHPVLTMNVPLVLVLTLPAASASKRYKPVTAWARSVFHCHWNSCDDC